MAGICARNGQGTTKNKELSFYWCKKSAENGNAISQFEVGVFCKHFAKDEQMARIWFEKSANQGYRQAQLQLRNMDDEYKPE